jgi:hypothetical protein
MTFIQFSTNFRISNEFLKYLNDKKNSGNKKLMNNVRARSGPGPSSADSAQRLWWGEIGCVSTWRMMRTRRTTWRRQGLTQTMGHPEVAGQRRGGGVRWRRWRRAAAFRWQQMDSGEWRFCGESLKHRTMKREVWLGQNQRESSTQRRSPRNGSGTSSQIRRGQ